MGFVGFYTLLKREVYRFLTTPIMSIFPPVISSALFVIIFGGFLGRNVGKINGFEFLVFFIPGIIVLNVITSSYQNSAFSLFLMRFTNHIKDILVTPLSYMEIILALSFGSIIRAFVTAILIFLTGKFFSPELTIKEPFLFLFFLVGISFIFSMFGLIVALLAEEFEHIEIFTVFLITPLTFLGGVFHSKSNLPEIAKTLTDLNPFFYLIDGFRASILGLNASEGNIMASIGLIVVIGLALFFVNLKMFNSGYKLRT